MSKHPTPVLSVRALLFAAALSIAVGAVAALLSATANDTLAFAYLLAAAAIVVPLYVVLVLLLVAAVVFMLGRVGSMQLLLPVGAAAAGAVFVGLQLAVQDAWPFSFVLTIAVFSAFAIYRWIAGKKSTGEGANNAA